MYHESGFCQAKPKFDEIAREFDTNESKKNKQLSSIISTLFSSIDAIYSQVLLSVLIFVFWGRVSDDKSVLRELGFLHFIV